MTSRYRIVTNTATQTATIVSESPILAWYQARIGDSDTIVTGLPTLDTIVAHNCQIVNRLDTIVTHNCNDAVWHGETTNVIKRDAKVTRATRAQITSFMRPLLRIFADPFIVVFT